MTQDIKALLEQLNQARKEAGIVGASKKELQDRLMADPALKMLADRKRIADDQVARLEEQVRTAAIDVLNREGTTKAPGYEIKHNVTLKVTDANRAKAWCVANFTPAIVLDEALFLKAVKSGAIPEELYDREDTNKVYIKSDLEKALHGETATSA